MEVYIVDTERNHSRRYQIMTRTGTLFEHLFPGKAVHALQSGSDLLRQRIHNRRSRHNMGMPKQIIERRHGK